LSPNILLKQWAVGTHMKINVPLFDAGGMMAGIKLGTLTRPAAALPSNRPFLVKAK
jgi:hypothetical protein